MLPFVVVLAQVKFAAYREILAAYGLDPDTNVHSDVGPYRFNRSAEEASNADNLQAALRAHDRKPADTGTESGQGTPFMEGVTG